MKEEWVQGAPLHSHTQLHTQGPRRLCGIEQGLPSSIVFLLGLLLPVAMVWVAKNPVGQRVKTSHYPLLGPWKTPGFQGGTVNVHKRRKKLG